MKRIGSLQHPLVKHLVKLRQDKKLRYVEKRAVIEGKKMISEEARRAKRIFTVEEAFLPKGECSAEVYLTLPEIVEKIAGTQSPEGIVAEVEMPVLKLPSCRYLLGLDGVADPGNLGTLLRAALALGWQGAFLLEGCCDPFNDKALRAAKGATFRLPLQLGTFAEFAELVQKNQLTPLVASLNGRSVADYKVPPEVALILGSESHGPSDQVLNWAEKITIPISPSMESLNVASAGAILMFELIRRG